MNATPIQTAGRAKAFWPADGNLQQVAHHMVECGAAWEPGVRLIGNCRACDIAAVAADYLRLRKAIEDAIIEARTLEGNTDPLVDNILAPCLRNPS